MAFFYLRYMKIKEELVKICGEKVGELFSNAQGGINPSELRSKLSFKEVVELQPKVISKPFNNLKQFCEESNMSLASEFMDSINSFVTNTYDKNKEVALMEESYETAEYKAIVKDKSKKVFESDKKNFIQETMKQLQTDSKVKTFFKTNLLNNNEATTFNNDELKEKIYLMSQVGIMNCILKQYKSLREKPVNKFESFFNEDTNNFSTSILYDIQNNGLI